jgi:hypothetical protein
MEHPRRPIVGHLLVVVLVALVTTAASTTTSTTSATSPHVVAPPREQSPFTPADDYCTRVTQKFKRLKPTDAGITKDAITVVLLTPSGTPSSGVAADGPVTAAADPADEAQAFGELIDKCGGINGRQLDLHVLVESADPQADCIQATEALHAFIVVTWTAFAAESCITNEHHTILITTGSPQSNATLANTHGRLITTDSNEGVLQARVLDLIGSGRLDDTKVGILLSADFPNVGDLDARLKELLEAGHARVVFNDDAAPDTAGDDALDLAGVIERFQRSGAKALITVGIGPAMLEALQNGNNLIPIYDLSGIGESGIDQLRETSGTTVAKFVNDTGVYTWTAVTEQDFRVGQAPGSLTAMCNRSYVIYRRPAAAGKDLPAPSPSVARICLALRIAARALWSAGPNPTQRSTIRALHALPYIEDIAGEGSPKPRPNQVINEPVTQVQRVVVLDKAEYPCRHPALPKDPASYRICLVPVQGWDDGGHAVNGPLWTN